MPAVDNGFIFENETSPSEQPAEVQSMVEVNTEAAYRLPQQFPLEYLRKLASAKRDEAEDEICTYGFGFLLPFLVPRTDSEPEFLDLRTQC